MRDLADQAEALVAAATVRHLVNPNDPECSPVVLAYPGLSRPEAAGLLRALAAENRRLAERVAELEFELERVRANEPTA